MTNTFKYWYNEIADMAEYVDGQWIDSETGIPFIENKKDKKEKTEIKTEIQKRYEKSTAKELKMSVSRFVDNTKYAINKWTSAADIDLSMHLNLIDVHAKLSEKRMTKAAMIDFIEMVSTADRYLNNQIIEKGL